VARAFDLIYAETIVISIAILAGGQSKRMGQDKAFLEVGGQPVIERVISRVRPLTDDLFIGANDTDKYAQFGLPAVPDIYPNKATLGGIYSAIYAARHDSVLIVACDMPLLNEALLHHLIGLAPTADVVVPVINPPQSETVNAIYSKRCLPAIERRLLAHKLRIIGFFEDVTVRYVDRAEVAQYDPDFYAFTNMNTPEEWHKVRALVEQLEKE
jgi:molybdopterin-guanine dinucleotide biosynthesis protein A